MEINMNENFHSIIGFILTRGDYPSFAIPYFVDRKGNICLQMLKNNKIEKHTLPLQSLLRLNGKHDYRGVNYKEETFFEKIIYGFAYSRYDFCIGSKEEVYNFINKTYKKHKRKIAKINYFEEINKFMVETRKELHNKNGELEK